MYLFPVGWLTLLPCRLFTLRFVASVFPLLLPSPRSLRCALATCVLFSLPRLSVRRLPTVSPFHCVLSLRSLPLAFPLVHFYTIHNSLRAVFPRYSYPLFPFILPAACTPCSFSTLVLVPHVLFFYERCFFNWARFLTSKWGFVFARLYCCVSPFRQSPFSQTCAVSVQPPYVRPQFRLRNVSSCSAAFRFGYACSLYLPLWFPRYLLLVVRLAPCLALCLLLPATLSLFALPLYPFMAAFTHLCCRVPLPSRRCRTLRYLY